MIHPQDMHLSVHIHLIFSRKLVALGPTCVSPQFMLSISAELLPTEHFLTYPD